MFLVEFSSQATKFIQKSDKNLDSRLIKKIELLQVDPFPKDVKRVVNRNEKIFRVRVGDYRIQYCVFYDQSEILVTEIELRERAY